MPSTKTPTSRRHSKKKKKNSARKNGALAKSTYKIYSMSESELPALGTGVRKILDFIRNSTPRQISKITRVDIASAVGVTSNHVNALYSAMHSKGRPLPPTKKVYKRTSNASTNGKVTSKKPKAKGTRGRKKPKASNRKNGSRKPRSRATTQYWQVLGIGGSTLVVKAKYGKGRNKKPSFDVVMSVSKDMVDFETVKTAVFAVEDVLSSAKRNPDVVREIMTTVANTR